MTAKISHEALEGKTIGEILQIEEQAKKLPEGFKVPYDKEKEETAEEIVNEVIEKSSSIKYRR